MSRSPSTEFQFDVFISFRHGDARSLARKTRDNLLNWRVPPGVGTTLSHPPKIYLDTLQRKATNDFWLENIVPSLKESRFLLIILSPLVYEDQDDGKENWVIREIREFLKTPQKNNIIPVFTDNTAGRELPEILLQHLPRIQYFNLHSKDSFLPTIPFFEKPADLELSLIAGSLFGVSPNDHSALLTETSRKQNQYIAKVATTALAIILSVGIAAILALWQGVRATKTAFNTDIRTSLQLSKSAPDESALYAVKALHTVTRNPLFRIWLKDEEARSRNVLGVLALPKSNIIKLDGRIENLTLAESRTRLAVSTDAGELALLTTDPLNTKFLLNPQHMGHYQEISISEHHVILKRNSPQGELIEVYTDDGTIINSLIFPANDDVLLLGNDKLLHRINHTGVLAQIDAVSGKTLTTLNGRFTKLQSAEALWSLDRIVVHSDSPSSYTYIQGVYSLTNGQAIVPAREIIQLDPSPRASAQNSLLVTQGASGKMMGTHLGTGKPVITFPDINVDKPAYFHLSPSGSTLTLSRAAGFNSLEIYDLNTGQWAIPPLTPFESYSPANYDSYEQQMSLSFKDNILLLNKNSGDSHSFLSSGGQPMEQVFLNKGQSLAIANLDGRVTVYDTEQAYPKVNGIYHQEGSVKLEKLTDTRLLSTGWDKSIRITDIDHDSRLVAELNQNSEFTNNAIIALRFHPIEHSFAYATSDGNINFCEVRINIPNLQKPIACKQQHTASHAVSNLQFVDNGRLLLASHHGSGGTLIDYESAEVIFEKNNSKIVANPDSSSYVEISNDTHFSIRSFRNPNFLRQCKHPVSSEDIYALSQHGSLLVRATANNRKTHIQAINTLCIQEWSTTLKIENPQFLSFTPDNRTLIAVGSNSAIAIDKVSAKTNSWMVDEKNNIHSLDYSKQSNTAYLSGVSGKVYARNTKTGVQSFSDIETQTVPWDITVSPQGNLLAISSVGILRDGASGTAIVDAGSGQQIGLPLQANYQVVVVDFSFDGQLLGTGDVNGGIKIWNLAAPRTSSRKILADLQSRIGRTIDFDTGSISISSN